METKWIDKLLDVDFKGRDILARQIIESVVTYRKEHAFISLKFEEIYCTEKYPYQIRVPVEMRAYQDKGAPVLFLLHIIDGLVNELEIVSADLSEIVESTISLENVKHEINSEVL